MVGNRYRNGRWARNLLLHDDVATTLPDGGKPVFFKNPAHVLA